MRRGAVPGDLGLGLVLQPLEIAGSGVVDGAEHREATGLFQLPQQRAARTGFLRGAQHVAAHRQVGQRTPLALLAGGFDRRLESQQQRALVRRQVLAGRVFGRGGDRGALGVAHDHQQRGAELAGGVLDRRQRRVTQRVAGQADHEQFAEPLVEHVLGHGARVVAAQHDRQRLLAVHQLFAALAAEVGGGLAVAEEAAVAGLQQAQRHVRRRCHRHAGDRRRQLLGRLGGQRPRRQPLDLTALLVQAGGHDAEAADLGVAAQQRAAAQAGVHHRVRVLLLAGGLQRTAAEVAGADLAHRRLDALEQVLHRRAGRCRRGLGADLLQAGGDRAAVLVREHDTQLHVQVFDRVFDAGDALGVGDMGADPDHVQLAEPGVEQVLRRDLAVGAGQHHRERALAARQRAPDPFAERLGDRAVAGEALVALLQGAQGVIG